MPNYSGKWTPSQILQARGQDLWPINGPFFYVDDVFSTYLWTGDSGTQSISNGIDLDGEGGLVWIKGRTAAYDNGLYDTERGATKEIYSNKNDSEQTNSDTVTSFNSDGFSIGADSLVNTNLEDYVSWSFRKQAGFFDVVTYNTVDAGWSNTFNHNLGSTPACIIFKRTNFSADWCVYHKDLTTGKFLRLNSTIAENTEGFTVTANSTSVTFSGTADAKVNGSNSYYVAYLFAHDDQRFGDTADQSIIKCGSYTTDANEDATINLGWEPQWLLVKRTDSSTAGDWRVIDSMRGWEAGGDAAYVEANTSDAEAQTGDGRYYLTSTGFKQDNFGANRDYIYIAIRRPMKTPESGTEVFAIDSLGSTGDGDEPGFRSSFPVDMALRADTSVASNEITSRLTQGKWLYTDQTAAEATASLAQFDYQNGWLAYSSTASNYYSWMFKRAPGFFDVVAYTGDGTAHAETHNLGVVPELLIVKDRSGVRNWFVWVNGFGSTDYLELNLTSQKQTGANIWNSTVPTDTQFSVGGVNNTSGNNFIAYLFATLAGISKVGSYTGTGSNVDVDCGFTAGARFILIKRTDSTGDWYVYDSLRGITSGNDPYLLLNSTAAEVTGTDYIDPLSSGFTVTSSAPAGLNASGGEYIFLAIA